MNRFSTSLLAGLAILAACAPKPEFPEPVVQYHEGRDSLVAGEFGYNPICPMGV